MIVFGFFVIKGAFMTVKEKKDDKIFKKDMNELLKKDMRRKAKEKGYSEEATEEAIKDVIK